ncbi:RNA methyltransferase TrmH, group 3, partial [Pseudomonas syringae pv. pisi str. 1704B]
PLLRRCRREHLGTMTLIASVTGTLHFGLLYCGIARVDASTSAIIYQLATPFTLVLACVALGEVLKLKVVAGIALAFAGVLVLLFNSAAIGSLPGMLLVALAAENRVTIGQAERREMDAWVEGVHQGVVADVSPSQVWGEAMLDELLDRSEGSPL